MRPALSLRFGLAISTVVFGFAFALILPARDALAQTSPPPGPNPGPPGAAPSAPPALAPSPLLDQPSTPATAEPLPSTEPPPPPPPPEEPPPPPPPPAAEDGGQAAMAGPFRQGTIRLTLLLGTGSTRTDTYFILGGGVGYYLINGLEVGLDYEAWIFASPVLQRLSPETRYVFWMVPTIKPYVGFFYRHTFIGDGYKDQDSLGGRLGVYYSPPRGRLYLGGGAVYEHELNCTNTDFVDCDSWYPEITVGVAF
jgi:hypothetical protein